MAGVHLFATTAHLLHSHREKVAAGVPGCTCGHSFPADSHREHTRLHAAHVSESVVFHVLAAAVKAVKAAVPGHEGATAVEAIATLAGPLPVQQKEVLGA